MIVVQYTVEDVRQWFAELRRRGEYIVDKSGCKMLEVIGATFVVNDATIFGAPNEEYIERELAWYKTMSRNVNDIPGGAPKIWRACATPDGRINSNYGWMIWSDENGRQYEHTRDELRKNPESRRAEMIYTRPTMWDDYNVDGMSDFVCTNDAQYFIRDGKLIALVNMRSCDSWAGFRNDTRWGKLVQEMLAKDLNVSVGELIWHVGSLHFYERNFNLIDRFIATGEFL